MEVFMRRFYQDFFKKIPFPACFVNLKEVKNSYAVISMNDLFKKECSSLKNQKLYDVIDYDRSSFEAFCNKKTQFFYEAECFLPNGQRSILYAHKDVNSSTCACYFSPDNECDWQQRIQDSKLDSIGHLAGGIAHDFNNILSIVLGYARALQDELVHDKQISHLDKIIKASQKGASLTRQLLAFSKQKIMLEAYEDINLSVEEQVDLTMRVLGSNIQVNLSKSDKPLIVKTAPDVIGQIMLNLLINSRDAINAKDDKNGNIDISLSYISVVQDQEKYPHGLAKIRVSDTGAGMSSLVMSKAFDPFFTTKDQGEGTGLGLSTVHGLVSQIGGTVSIQSVNEKTIFDIEIPLAKPIQNIQEVDVIAKACSLKGKTILIAEDEKDLAYLLKSSLKRIGMSVSTAKTGKEALDILEGNIGRIDFLLTDIVMPEMHGMYLGEIFSKKSPDTHIIYMSGYPSRNSFSQLIEVPKGCHILAKPIQIDAVVYLMEQLILGAKEHEIERIYKSLERCV